MTFQWGFSLINAYSFAIIFTLSVHFSVFFYMDKMEKNPRKNQRSKIYLLFFKPKPSSNSIQYSFFPNVNHSNSFWRSTRKKTGEYFAPFSQKPTDLKGKFCFPVLYCIVPALLHEEGYLSLTLNDLLKTRKAVSVRVGEFCLLIQSSNDKTIYLIK